MLFIIKMGFDGFFLGRIDYDDKHLRLNTSTMEMIWRGSQSLKDASDIFTGVLYNEYAAPEGFCFDAKCGVPPIQVSICVYNYVLGVTVSRKSPYSTILYLHVFV